MVINSKIESLERAGVEFESNRHAFSLGYISGMSNPSFEAIKEAIAVMKLYDSLDKKGKEIIMLVMDGMKSKYKKAGEVKPIEHPLKADKNWE